MPPQFTLPPDNRSIGSGNPPADMNAHTDALIAMGAGLNVLNAAFAGGADPTGAADSAAAIQAALNAVPAGGGAICLPPGTYKLASTVTNAVTPTRIQGSGRWATTVNFTGTGDAIRMYNPSGSGTGVGGGVRDLAIDGTSAGAGSTGLHIGDGSNYDLDCVVQNFSGTGSIGFHFDNTVWWAEKIHGNVYASNCTQGVVFDVTGATTSTFSFGYCDLHVWINAGVNAGQDGVVLQNGARIYNGSLTIQGNWVGSSSALSNYVLRLTGTVPAGHPNAGAGSQIIRSRLDIMAETTTGANTPGTIFTNVAGTNVILGCYGVINFGGGTGSFTATNHPANSNQATFWYNGIVNGDNNLNPGAITLPVSLGGHLYSSCFFNTNGDLFVASGDFFRVTLTQNITVNFNASTNVGAPRRITLIIIQAAGGGFTVTWPHTGSPTTGAPTVNWAGGTAPTMTATANAVDVYKLETINGATWYGQALQNVS